MCDGMDFETAVTKAEAEIDREDDDEEMEETEAAPLTEYELRRQKNLERIAEARKKLLGS